MRYVMKQTMFAMGNDFTIKDADGRDRYFVDGHVLTIGDKLSFQDTGGTELLRIEQRLFSWGPTYELLRGNSSIATVKKQVFTLFRSAFDIEDEAAGDLDADGDFFDLEYEFTRDGRTIARVSKTFFAWTDTYGVDIVEGEDDVLLLACAVVIDLCCHDD